MIKCCIVGVLFFVSCTLPVRNYLKSADENKPPLVTSVDTVVNEDAMNQIHASGVDSVLSIPPSYSIEQWTGKDFVVLAKQQMFKNFGYELFLSKQMENNTSPIDTSLELKKHRLRWDKCSGHTLTCKSVVQVQEEWIVEFFDSTLNKEIWAKTYKKAIKDLAIKKDFEGAQNRWLGKTVFSKRGVISTNESKNGYGSMKVLIQDSLRVTEICWGVTPLPVKPLWLIVETKEKLKGFIPIRISWTNLMSDQLQQDAPWDEDIFENDPSVMFKWDAAIWEMVNNHRVVNEMNPEQVLTSWGKPLKRFKKELNGSLLECWRYQSQTLYFGDKGIVAVMNE
jgi:hypothetical protein